MGARASRQEAPNLHALARRVRQRPPGEHERLRDTRMFFGYASTPADVAPETFILGGATAG